MFQADVVEIRLSCPEELRGEIDKDPCFVADLRLCVDMVTGMLECESSTIKYGHKQVTADLEAIQSVGVRGYMILGLGHGDYTRYKLTDAGVWQAFGVISFGEPADRLPFESASRLERYVIELDVIRREKEQLEEACAGYIETITRLKSELDEANRAVVILTLKREREGEI